MTGRERRVERAEWLINRDLRELGDDLRTARLAAGLTLRSVAGATGLSPQTVLRAERPDGRLLDPRTLAGIASAVGLRIRIKAYPEGAPLRDAPQIALIREFRERLGRGTSPLLLEQPAVSVAGDLRAFDARMDIPGGCGLEFITRFHDCQAQLRAATLKQRDSEVARLVIVIKDTHANRRAIAAVRDVVSSTFPIGARRAMAALSEGRDPGGNAIVFV